MAYTDDQRREARQELAKRELARRQSGSQPEQQQEEIPYTPPPKQTGWGSVAEDTLALPGKALDYLSGLPNKARASGTQAHEHPGRALLNLLAGTGEAAIGTLNLPHEGLKYLGEKQVIPDWLKKYNELPFTHLPHGDLQKFLAKNPQEGDEFLQELPGLLAGGKALRSLPGIKGSGKRIAAQLEHGPLKRQVETLEKQHEVAKQADIESQNQYNALRDFLENQAGFKTSNPNALNRKANEAQLKKAQLQEQVSQIPESFRAQEEPLAPEKTPLSLIEPVRAAEKPEISDANIRQAENVFKTNAQKSAEHEAKISQYLGEGNAHRKRVAAKLNPTLEARQSEIGNGYDNYIEGLKGKDIKLSNPREAKEIIADMQEGLKKHDTTSENMKRLFDELDNLGKGTIVPADKFVSAYRTLRSSAQKVRSSAYGKSQDEFNRLIAQADAMDADVEKMAHVIDDGLGEDNLKELHKLNHRYATEVAPLFKNKFFQHMQRNNKAPINMIEQLTNEPFIKSTNPNKVTGTQILNQIIKADPELLQNVVGERFAHKPDALHQWDEAANSFIQHMPELQKMRAKHFEAKQNEAQAKLDLDTAKQQHQMQKEQAVIEHRKQVKEAAEQTRIKKAQVHNENQAKQKEYDQKSEHFKLHEQIQALDQQYATLSENAKKMQAKANAKNITLKEKMAIETQLEKTMQKLSKLQKDRNLLKKVAKGIGYTALGVAVGTPAFKKTRSFIGIGG